MPISTSTSSGILSVGFIIIIIGLLFSFSSSPVTSSLSSESDFEIIDTEESSPTKTKMSAATTFRPSAFISISHGGGPMPLLGRDPDSVNHWQSLTKKYILQQQQEEQKIIKPDVFVVISAHYHRKNAAVVGSPQPKMIYDYGGFPPETYQYKYPAPGHPQLAERIYHAFKKHPVLSSASSSSVRLETGDGPENGGWGYDHGTFVPMMKINPEADVPIVPVSVSSEDDAEVQLAIGEALHDALFSSNQNQEQQEQQKQKPLNVVVIASGSPGHNFDLIFNPPKDGKMIDPTFNIALKELLTDTKMSKADRKEKLLRWRETLPKSTLYQPIGGADHFMPLLSLIAAADYQVPSFVEDYTCFKYQVSDFIWKY